MSATDPAASPSPSRRRPLLWHAGSAVVAQVALLLVAAYWTALPPVSALWVFLFWTLMLYADARRLLDSRWYALAFSAGVALALAIVTFVVQRAAI